ncbi:MAG TPA: hypothetical protein VLU46_12600, partial [Thermoanaerobaculia bacterium]|nr:hypothetical protein [Thermoanaerobaculia bacterium]
DPFRRLPKNALVRHIDEAIRAWGCAGAADLAIEYLEPVIGAQLLRIDLWVESLDKQSCTYGFFCSSENGNVAYARGERTVVTPTDSGLRNHNAELLKDLHAYA